MANNQEKYSRAVEIFLSYLVIERLNTSNSKLHSSKDDRMPTKQSL